MEEQNQNQNNNQAKRKFGQGLIEFLRENSVIGMAIGVIVAQISKSVIDSIVNGLFTPLISLVMPNNKIGNLVFQIRGAKFDFGSIISAFLSFVIAMTVLYIVVKKILKNEELLKKK